MGYSSSGNRSLNIKFTSQENMTPEQVSVITNNEGKYGHLLFLTEGAEQSELVSIINNLPKLVADDDEKTPSQRLRAVLYIYHRDKCKDGRSFDEFYRNYLEKIIDQIKENLNA